MITKLGRVMGERFGNTQRRAGYLRDDSRADRMIQNSAESKSEEDKTSWGKAIGTGAGIGGSAGALAGRVAGGSPRKAILGAGLGAATGGLLGAGEKQYDDIQTEDAERAKSENENERAHRLAEIRMREQRMNNLNQALSNRIMR